MAIQLLSVVHAASSSASSTQASTLSLPRFSAPDYFWRDLEEKNSHKPLDASVIIVLQSEKDDLFHSCSDPCDLFAIQEFAQMHFVVFKVTDCKKGILAPIRDAIKDLAYQQRTGEIKALILSGHGTANSIEFSQERTKYRTVDHNFTTSDLYEEFFDDLPFDRTTIILHACSTGQGLGPTIARMEPHITVIAPMNPVDAHDTHLHYSETDGFSMLSTRSPIYSNQMGPLDHDDYPFLYRRMAYLEKLIQTGTNIRALSCMGAHFQGGILVPPSKKQAVGFYIDAAQHGDLLAQRWMSDYYSQESGFVQSECAHYWHLQMAKQGDARSQYIIGVDFEWGLRGVRRSIAQAREWYLKAAQQELHEAYCALGRINRGCYRTPVF
jgi:hypothetical protein